MKPYHLIAATMLCLTFGSGCATTPFEPIALTPMDDNIRVEHIRREVAESMPDRFSILQTAVFEYRHRSMTAISVIDIDTPERAFRIAAVTPVGMKLFEIAGHDGSTETTFLAPGLDERGDPAAAIAEDIQRVYFDRIPAAQARVSRKTRKIVFSTPTPDGVLEHVLGGSPAVLLEKRLTTRRGLIWSVSYHDYEDHNGRLHPGGIVFTHRRYGYRIILRLKDVLDAVPDPKGGAIENT